jgi:hypothetical protein
VCSSDLALAALVAPRLGLSVMWFILFLYPTSLLYGLMPLDIRFDDLWVVMVFLLAIFYSGGVRSHRWLLALAIFWWLSIFVGDTAGFLITGGTGWEPVLKNAAKSLYVPMTTFAIGALLTAREQLDRHLKWFAIAGAAGGVLAIAMLYFPTELQLFSIPRLAVIGSRFYTGVELTEAAEVTVRRAEGAIGTMQLAQLMMNLTLLSLCMMLYHDRRPMRILFGIVGAVCAVTLAYTATRNAIAGLIVALVWGVAFTRRRWTLVGAVGAGVILLMIQGGVLERVLSRVTGPTAGGESTLAAGFASRLDIWNTFADNFSPIYLFTGMGMTTVGRLAKATAHNSYLGALVYGGLFGATVLALIIFQGFRLGRHLRREAAGSVDYGLGVYMTMAVIAAMVSAVAIESFQLTGPMQILFAAMVFVQIRLMQVRQAQESPLLVRGDLPLPAGSPYAAVS